MRKKCKKSSNIEKIFLARFAHSAFYKIHISGAANCMPQFNMQNMLFFFFFFSFFFFFFFLFSVVFFSKLFEPFTSFVSFSYEYIIIYWLILTVNHQGSYIPSSFFFFFFFFFLSLSSGSSIFVPQQIL